MWGKQVFSFTHHKLPLSNARNICFPHLWSVIHMVSIIVIVFIVVVHSLFLNGRMAFSPYAIVYTTHRGQVDQQVTTITTINNSNQLLHLTAVKSKPIDSRALCYLLLRRSCCFLPIHNSGRRSERICCIRQRCFMDLILHVTISTHLLLCSGSVLSPKIEQKEDENFFIF